ncbi:MAG: hypothetical protein RL701_2797 [Pseudomonadota bacterium]
MITTPLEPGMMIGGRYRLDRLLGQGGMGSVFAAENTLTGKQVAIKCMHKELAASPEASQRFVREAKASARIRHPNVVDVYDVLSEAGSFFLVMEYLEGEPLASLMMRENTPLPQLIKYVIGAMRGVAAAHRIGVIHRDIKPENIFLAHEGDDQQIVPKVLDFGISKMSDTQDIKLTAPGAALGTILYMSTEQLTGASDVDARADVYAFGVILYQALTGRVPFESETLSALIIRIMTEQAIPVKQVRPDVPTKLSLLVQAAMAKQRDDRVPSLEAFIAALEPFADETKFRDQMTLPVANAPAIRTPHSAPPGPNESSSAAFHARSTEPAPQEPSHASAATPIAQAITANSAIANETPYTASDSLPDMAIPRTSFRGVWLIALAALVLLAFWFWRAGGAPQAEAPKGPQDQHLVTPAAPGEVSATGHAPPATEDQPRGVSPPPSQPKVDVKQVDVTAPQPTAAKPTPTPTPSVSPAPAATPRPRPNPSAAPEREKSSPSPVAHTVKPGCNPNFYFDAQGDKHFKPECF